MLRFLKTPYTLIPVVFLLFSCAPTARPSRQAALHPAPRWVEPGSVTGRVLINGQQLFSEGRVSFFRVENGPPYLGHHLRRVPEVSIPVHRDGTFVVKLRPGRYFVGALSRNPPSRLGPPRPGEPTYSAIDAKGTLRIIDVMSGRKNDVGAVTVTPRREYPAISGLTIKGSVTDAQGRPFAGAFLFIKLEPNRHRPNFIWGKTGKNGLFSVTLPAGKSYYLVAKDMVKAGRPSTGKYIGAYNGPDNYDSVLPMPVAITGRKGQTVSGIRIVMHAVPQQAEQRGAAGRPPGNIGKAPVRPLIINHGSHSKMP